MYMVVREVFVVMSYPGFLRVRVWSGRSFGYSRVRPSSAGPAENPLPTELDPTLARRQPPP